MKDELFVLVKYKTQNQEDVVFLPVNDVDFFGLEKTFVLCTNQNPKNILDYDDMILFDKEGRLCDNYNIDWHGRYYKRRF